MKKTGRSVLTNFLLVFAIIGILGIGYAWFIGGPSRAYEDQDLRYVTEFMEGEDFDDARMVSRFSFDTVYYVLEVSKDGVSSLVWFNDDFTKGGQHPIVEFSSVYALADTYGVDYDSISFGVYEDKLVYVLRRQDLFELFVSVDSLEIVLHMGGVY